MLRSLLSAALLLTFSAACHAQSTDIPSSDIADGEIYSYGPASRDGIGKFYMGREISHVMGYRGMEWLERPEREISEMPEQVVAALDLRPDDVVADIGAGSGYFTFRISPRVPDGRVLAVDVQPEMLAVIEERAEELGMSNVVPVAGTETSPNLPESSVDLALMVDAYHEFSYPHEMMKGLVRALKPGGRVALVEYRGEDPTVPIKELHKMTQAQARREMGVVGLSWRETLDFLPRQHLMIFEKSKESSASRQGAP